MDVIDACRRGPSPSRSIALGLAAIVGVYLVGLLTYFCWITVDEFGLSRMSGKPPTWDFTNLWMGGRLALTQSLETIFTPDLYRAAMRAAFGATVTDSEWSYPPSILLVGAPLSLLPLTLAYALFTVGGVAALIAACRAGGLSNPLCALVAVSPAVLLNATFGQNGAWTAALLLGGLILAERRPLLAGLLIGLLTMKPHLGVLVPLCLIAGGHWRGFGWASLFSLALAGATTAVFGLESWRLFLTETRPLMQAILEARWGSAEYQMMGMSVFLLARSLGGSLDLAYAAQAVAALVAAGAAWRLWRIPDCDPLLRAATTALLTLLASPYGFGYDLIPLSVAVVALAAADREFKAAPLAVAFLWPAITARVTFWFLPLSPLVLAFAAAACWRAAARRTEQAIKVSPQALSEKAA